MHGFLNPILSQTKEDTKVELKFSIDTRFGLGKGSFKKTSIMVKDRKAGLGIIEIDTSSIDTGNSMRDTHLRDPDFLMFKNFRKQSLRFLD